MAAISFRRNPLGRVVLALLIALPFAVSGTASAPGSAHAEDNPHIDELANALSSPHSERARIDAVTALSRLASKPTLKPLVTAMSDASPAVRAIAASGLGKLAHRAALPVLRKAATDEDPVVRKHATEAVTRVCTANGIPLPAPTPSTEAPRKSKPIATKRPDLYVVLKSTNDDSSGDYGKKGRKVHADLLRSALGTKLTGAAKVTTHANEAARWDLELRTLDLSITSIATRRTGTLLEVDAQLRVAISDQRGRMLSVLTGGAKVQVPHATFNRAYLPQLRREAIENAVHGLFGKLMSHLRNDTRS